MDPKCRLVGRLNSQPRPRGFTLVELLVVISVIALLMSILLPSLRKAREQARQVQCAAHMAGFGRGFFGYATENRDYLCSGSFDPDIDNGRDGPVDRVGWVADLVNQRYAFPAEQLCPSNEARVNQKLGQGGVVSGSGCFGKTYSNGDDYQTWDLIDGRIRRGYNTNYTQSWYMARTEMKEPPAGGNRRRVADTLGPLRLSFMTKVSPGRVPLLGDGGLEGNPPDGDTYLGGLGLGQRTVKTMTDGAIQLRFLPQNYSDFGPAHGFSSTRSQAPNSSIRDRANILFADGHASVFIDKAIDGRRDGQFTVAMDPALQDYRQQDVDAQVFDGVISLGRRSAHGNVRR